MTTKHPDTPTGRVRTLLERAEHLPVNISHGDTLADLARALVYFYRLRAGCNLVYRKRGYAGQGVGAPNGVYGAWTGLERTVAALSPAPESGES